MAAGIGLLTGCNGMREVKQPNSPAVGTTAPDFTLKSLSGRMVTLSEQRGKPVLLAFGAVDCGPCRLEAPHLSAMQERYGGRGLVVLSVNAWNEPRRKVEKHVADNRLKQTILMNGGEIFMKRYGCKYVPQVYVIDKQGVITYSHLNFQPGDEKEFDAEVLKVL